MIERRRIPFLLLVLALLAGGGLANAFVRHREANSRGGGVLDVSSVSPSSGATSTAWYCAGPLPVGSRPQSSSITVANISSARAVGSIVEARTDGSLETRRLFVGAHGSSLVALSRAGKAGFAGVTVLVNGSGIGVAETVHEPGGAFSAPCTSHTATSAYLGGGSTKAAANVTLSIMDPGATPAVASVSVLTDDGLVAPPAFQGIPIGAGQLVALDIGHYVPSTRLVAPVVTSMGGEIAVGAIDTVPFGAGTASSIVSATARPASSWSFSAAPGGAGARQTYYIADPGSTAAAVLASFTGSAGTAKMTINVAPGAVAAVDAAPDPDASGLRFAVVQSPSNAPVVVERATTIEHDVPASGRAGGHGLVASLRAAAILPRLLPGYGVTSATTGAFRSWLFPAGEVDAATDEVLALSNPDQGVLHANVHVLGTTVDYSATIAANSTATVDLAALVKHAVSLSVVVDGSSPLLASELLYGRRAQGFSDSPGIPVS